MPESFQNTTFVWQVITHLGSASLVIPLFLVVVLGLLYSHQQGAVRAWLLALGGAVALTLATKIAFIGWGIGIKSLDFTGISGHTLLATSVLPLLFYWLWVRDDGRFRIAAASFGWLVGAVVGVSRVVLGAHSVSEVVSAWIIGVVVSSLALRGMSGPIRRPWFAFFSPLIFLLALGSGSSTYLPTHEWEIRIALLLAGRDKPFTRQLPRYVTPMEQLVAPPSVR